MIVPCGPRDRGHGDLIVSYNALLRAYCECHCLREALAAYHSMPHKNLPATLTTMNTLMSGYAKVRPRVHSPLALCSGEGLQHCRGRPCLVAPRMPATPDLTRPLRKARGGAWA